jgi:hypothetical protein
MVARSLATYDRARDQDQAHIKNTAAESTHVLVVCAKLGISSDRVGRFPCISGNGNKRSMLPNVLNGVSYSLTYTISKLVHSMNEEIKDLA